MGDIKSLIIVALMLGCGPITTILQFLTVGYKAPVVQGVQVKFDFVDLMNRPAFVWRYMSCFSHVYKIIIFTLFINLLKILLKKAQLNIKKCLIDIK